MLTLIHGDNIPASRNYLIEMKRNYPTVPLLDGSSVTQTELIQILEGGDLFSDEKVLFMENFLSRKKQSSEFKELLAYIVTQSQNATIILWEEKEIDKRTISILKNATVRLFKLPQPLFSLLDSLKPKNGSNLIRLFHEVLQTVDDEMVFYMLIRHIRILLGIYKEPASIEEIKRLQDWQRTKIIKQARLFSEKELIALHHKLYEIEKGLKTGTLSMSLSASIDILLLEI
jgi:hypothetical protein